MRLLRLWLPVVLWSAIILFASGDLFSEKHTGGWLHRFTGHDVPRWAHFALRKSGHVVGYAILGALAFRASSATWKRRRNAMLVGLVIALAVASTDEFHQSMTHDRRGAPDDVLLDTSSAGLAIAAMSRRRRT